MQELRDVNPGSVFSETATNGMSSAAVSASFDNSKIPEVPHSVTVCGVCPLGPRHKLGII